MEVASVKTAFAKTTFAEAVSLEAAFLEAAFVKAAPVGHKQPRSGTSSLRAQAAFVSADPGS